jgi:FkbM family methyltransferase
MDCTLIKTKLKNGFFIFSPERAASMIKDIWEKKIYNKNYSISDGDIVIDIGANIGIFSLFAASNGARVYAFEPNAEAFAILRKNVEENNLGNIIKIFEYAISDHNGFIDLHIPDSEAIYALGSATCSDSLKAEMIRKRGIVSTPVRVRTIMLKLLFEAFIDNNGIVDFLKMDCEGAEYSILKAADVFTVGKIKNIAMETHEGYLEKALAELMNEQGFVIDHYVKRSGHYKNGYCFARRGSSAACGKKAALSPVAIVDAPNVCFVNDPIRISAESSFVPNDTHAPLSYSWEIGGKELQEKRNVFDYVFSEPGVSWISCSVSNGSDCDCMGKKVVILEPNYRQKKPTCYLLKESEVLTTLIGKQTIFCIDKNNLPKIWDFDLIGIALFPSDQNSPLLHPQLESNGKVYNLQASYNEVEIDSVCADSDVIFTLVLDREAEIKIKWWPKKAIENAIAIHEVEKNGCFVLGNMGTEPIMTIDRSMKVKVLKDALPKDGAPHTLAFGIAAIPTNGINTHLNGYFEYKGTRSAAADWYTEFGISNYDLDSDVEFTLHFKEKRNIKISWWSQ